MFSRVDLPQPEGPISETTSPLAMEIDTSCTAASRLPLCLSAKDLPTFLNSISIMVRDSPVGYFGAYLIQI